MNSERMLKMAEVLEKGTEKYGVLFDMKIGYGKLEETVHNCNTVCCIAGLACLMFGELDMGDFAEVTEILDLREKGGPETAVEAAPWNLVMGRAQVLLDLPYGAANKLFQPEGFSCHGEPFTAKNAARVLKYMAHTGVCIWSDIVDEFNSNKEEVI